MKVGKNYFPKSSFLSTDKDLTPNIDAISFPSYDM